MVYCKTVQVRIGYEWRHFVRTETDDVTFQVG